LAVEKNIEGLYETEIDGRAYEFEMWGAEESMDALLDIAAILGKPLSKFGAKAVSKGVAAALGEEVGNDSLSAILENLVDQVTGNRAMVMRLVKKLTTHKVFCERKKIAFDIHYRNELPHAWRVAAVALEVQYGNFFDAASGLIARPQRPQAGMAMGAAQ
jgi:hypothetical protein